MTKLRKSILTYISEFDDAVIADAIDKELRRQGQVFFVHNNIQSIRYVYLLAWAFQRQLLVEICGGAEQRGVVASVLRLEQGFMVQMVANYIRGI